MKRFALLLTLLVVGCSTASTGPSPASSVYAAKEAYAAVLTAAVVYNGLPRCGQPASPPVCSDPNAVGMLRQANNSAVQALTTAEAVVRQGGNSAAMSAAVSAAQQAVAALAALLKQFGG